MDDREKTILNALEKRDRYAGTYFPLLQLLLAIILPVIIVILFPNQLIAGIAFIWIYISLILFATGDKVDYLRRNLGRFSFSPKPLWHSEKIMLKLLNSKNKLENYLEKHKTKLMEETIELLNDISDDLDKYAKLDGWNYGFAQEASKFRNVASVIEKIIVPKFERIPTDTDTQYDINVKKTIEYITLIRESLGRPHHQFSVPPTPTLVNVTIPEMNYLREAQKHFTTLLSIVRSCFSYIKKNTIAKVVGSFIISLTFAELSLIFIYPAVSNAISDPSNFFMGMFAACMGVFVLLIISTRENSPPQ